MLICGKINPPPIADDDYCGVYFSSKDNVQAKAHALRGTPLRVEHNNNTHVGEVLQGWTHTDGSMWALAEIDVSQMQGAVTAAAIEQGNLGGFSLGYLSNIKRNSKTGKLKVEDKRIIELSIVKEGAHRDCAISSFTPHVKKTRSLISKKRE